MSLLLLVYATVTPCYMANQRIQNSAARIVTNTRKYDRITPILQKLHWQPVRQRIHLKVLLITYKYNMVIVRLVLQPPLCGIGCRQILEMRHFLKKL